MKWISCWRRSSAALDCKARGPRSNRKKTVALANKETLVMAGGLVKRLAAERGATILPVDSEHSAIFQALEAGRPEEVRRIVLTASGGPFRELSLEQLKQVTVDDALSHPTWDMGPKITVDSATMMNKALEIIESRWLFDLTVDQISVVIHPAIDGAFVRRVRRWLGDRAAGSAGYEASDSVRARISESPTRHRQNDWIGPNAGDLDFEPADEERCPALSLGYECARAGGTTGAVLNAANEAAVKAFLEGELHFTEIVPACRSVLEAHHFEVGSDVRTTGRARSLGAAGGHTLGMCLIGIVEFGNDCLARPRRAEGRASGWGW